jgi:hypothetical protein
MEVSGDSYKVMRSINQETSFKTDEYLLRVQRTSCKRNSLFSSEVINECVIIGGLL